MLAPWPATVAMLAGNMPAVPRRWPATRTRRVILWDDIGKPRAALLSRAATPASEIRVRAQRRAGEMLKQAAEQGQRALPADGVKRGANKHSSQPATSAPTLAEIGITKSESSRYQQLAAMPAEHFETAVATAKATGRSRPGGEILAGRRLRLPHPPPFGDFFPRF